MTFRELEIFFSLSENPSVSSVAKEKGLSQSAVSLAIKSLENDLGERLFDRIGKKLILNERGRLFRQKSFKSFLELKDARNLFSQNKLSGVLKISASKTIGTFVIPKSVYRFLENYKEVKIIKETKNSTQIIKSVLNGEIDMGFIETECENENIIKEKIGEDELVIVCGEEYKKEVFIDELQNKKWLLREKGSGTREMFLNALGEYGKNINIFMEFSGFVEIKNLLRHKDTITCISKYAVEDELSKKELFEVKVKNFEFKRNFYLIYHKNRFKTLLFKKFCEFVKDKNV